MRARGTPIRPSASSCPAALPGGSLRELHAAVRAALALTDKAIVAGYLALVDKVCPCVMLLHSQGGTFGFQVAEQRPDKIKGIVAVEAASPGNIANAPKLKEMPVLQIFGDYVDQHPRWSTSRSRHGLRRGDQGAGGTAEWINLPDIGIKGNSHMLMQDKNSDQIAEVIQQVAREQEPRRIERDAYPPRQRAHRPARHGLVPCRRPAVEISGKPVKEVVFTPGGVPAKVDPNGTYQVEQMYSQYFLVQNRNGKLPLLMWHGGGLTGVTYETKPDGKPGWLNYFLRQGWDVYISDAMERGRSGWTNQFKGEPVFLPLGDPWERFRIGPIGSWIPRPAKRATYPGTQFPIEAYEQFMKQGVPRWVTTDKEIVAAYIALVDKVCPCVVMVHSQSGTFGFQVLEARPDKVKALIAVEPTVGGDRSKVASIKSTPITMIYGDSPRIIRAGRRSARAASTMPACSRPRAAASTSSICRTRASAATATWS